MTGQQLIPLKQVLAEMQAAKEPFSLTYVKLNEGKKQGGEVVQLPSVLLSGRKQQEEATAPVVKREGARAFTGNPETDMETVASITRDPNHFDNMTRNLVSTLNSRFTKVHIWLILEFNGKKVII
jgi:hypothetical protein